MAGATAPAVFFGVSSFSGFAASGSSPGGQLKAPHRIFRSRHFPVGGVCEPRQLAGAKSTGCFLG
jgi:hypothetical protein